MHPISRDVCRATKLLLISLGGLAWSLKLILFGGVGCRGGVGRIVVRVRFAVVDIAVVTFDQSRCVSIGTLSVCHHSPGMFGIFPELSLVMFRAFFG